MTTESSSKIQILLNSWPEGTVATSVWLNKFGISDNLIHKYKTTGWVEQFGKAAFVRSNKTIEWYGALYSIQFQLDLSLYVGGKTALEYQGLAHYIAMGVPTVDLFKTPNVDIPKWFTNHIWPEKVRIVQCGCFSPDLPHDFGIEIQKIGNLDIKMSNRERAAIELLYFTPRIYTFDEVPLILESLASLRGEVLTELLMHCTSEKAKRLILYFGENNNFYWYKRLDLSKIKIGSSLLKVVPKGGKFIKKYNMVIPQEYDLRDETEFGF